ncbi:MAG: dTDP-4-dehydrorhamnose reductase [Moraxellaceae bacterium]|nr:dTDP-4-dehydrorhamnose reductase [Moraxellaceae bacterium]MDZ4386039.1 dTDP-4-dehydrorhamnose reductase [Moraxellaceae bacterium]
MFKRILLLGGSGQLGQVLQPLLKDFSAQTDLQLLAPTRQVLDLNNTDAISDYVAQHKPDLIINAAAMTQVDDAETNPALADAINHRAVAALAYAAKQHDSAFLQLSTDQVFDGSGSMPHVETDWPNPINAYGRSKWAGEQVLAAAYDGSGLPWWVLRTSWLYGEQGPRWLQHIDSNASVVTDQIGAPTSALWLAHIIVQIIQDAKTQPMESGIYHATMAGQTSKFDQAQRHLMQRHLMQLGQQPKLKPIKIEDFKQAVAKRPLYTVLNSDKLAKALNLTIPQWTEATDIHFMQLALNQAKIAEANGEVPVGAVVVAADGQTVLAQAHNAPITANDPTAHAEISALRMAAAAINNYRLDGCTLYVTLEPCTMCVGALVHARIAKVVFAASEPKAGSLQSQRQLMNEDLSGYYNHRFVWQGGVLAHAAALQLRTFFKARRQT